MAEPRAEREHLVQVEGLTKVFPGRRSLFGRRRGEPQLAVDRVDLSLAEGEIFGLVGPNGAGKTTLIKLLTTLLRPSEGRASIAGLDVVRDEYRVRRLVGLVTSNERSFYWRLTGRQNLEFFASLYDIPRREARQWIDELFDLLDLTHKADERFDAYSTGMKQRLAFARGLLFKPRFLFMDEPTKGVDPVSRAELVRILEERIIARWHPTVLITSHDLGEIERLCGRMAVMNDGRFVAVGSLEELRALARPVDRFRLRVRNVAEDRLRELATRSRAGDSLELSAQNGTVQVAVEFAQGTDEFAGFVRGIVETGGDLLDCTSVKDSFDDVFQRLISDGAGGES